MNDQTIRLTRQQLYEKVWFQSVSKLAREIGISDVGLTKICKRYIDEIDRVLAGHYGFTAEGLDFIINYDIKYPMGASDAENNDGV